MFQMCPSFMQLECPHASSKFMSLLPHKKKDVCTGFVNISLVLGSEEPWLAQCLLEKSEC